MGHMINKKISSMCDGLHHYLAETNRNVSINELKLASQMLISNNIGMEKGNFIDESHKITMTTIRHTAHETYTIHECL